MEHNTWGQQDGKSRSKLDCRCRDLHPALESATLRVQCWNDPLPAVGTQRQAGSRRVSSNTAER